jgi:ribosomal-protein-serine acetyltransferase
MNAAYSALAVDDEIALVPRHPSDAGEFYTAIERHRTELREWLTWVDATRSVGDMRRYTQFAQLQFEQQAAFDYAIRLRGAVAGAVGLHHLDWMVRNAHVGYWLVPEAQGQGVVTRAVARLTSHAFSKLDLNRLEIRAVVENRKSRAVAERVGYTYEGTLRESYLLHGVFRDLVLYAMVSGSWDAGANVPLVR